MTSEIKNDNIIRLQIENREQLRKSEAENFTEKKEVRAIGGILGTESRRRTQQAAISYG